MEVGTPLPARVSGDDVEAPHPHRADRDAGHRREAEDEDRHEEPLRPHLLRGLAASLGKREFYDLLKQFDTLQIRENEKINHRVERLKQRAEAIRGSINNEQLKINNEGKCVEKLNPLNSEATKPLNSAATKLLNSAATKLFLNSEAINLKPVNF